jgi:hypothetical protein
MTRSLLPNLGVEAGLAPSDFVDERHLDTVVGLISRSSQRDAGQGGGVVAGRQAYMYA